MKWIFCCILPLLGFVACKKSETNTNVAPTNLTLVANIANDSSGNVTFTASATNAVSYEFDYGNGNHALSTNGVVTYKYPTGGVYEAKVTAKSSSGQTASKTISINVPVALTLVFSDEFSEPGAPNPSKWGYDLGAGGWGNNEQQHYTNSLSNAVVSNGTLKITAIKEAISGSQYSSARLLTKNKFSFKYGKVEARAKLPIGGGTWPAIWMLGNNFSSVGWPSCGEIDIMEHVGNTPNKIYGTLHYPGHSGGNANGTTTMISNAQTEFHIYTLEWNEGQIKIGVDGTNFFTFANNSTTPFNQPFFLIMNLAMGGNLGGTIDPAFTSASMEVDYIRVYQ